MTCWSPQKNLYLKEYEYPNHSPSRYQTLSKANKYLICFERNAVILAAMVSSHHETTKQLLDNIAPLCS